MKFLFTTALLLASSIAVKSISIPDVKALAVREADTIAKFIDARDLEKRRGGGGHSGGESGGESSGSGGGKSGGSSSGSKSGSDSGSSPKVGPSNSFSSSSNLGGQTRSGSGVSPSYGGGRYYGGGAAVPYTAGRRSPLGLTPFLLPIGALAIFPGLWLYGAYGYPYHNNVRYTNRTDNNTATRNETLPVLCLCQQYSVCGCDDNGNATYVAQLLGNGSVADMNSSLIRVAKVNGTKTAVINGTLPNGTTASGGTDASSADQLSGAARRFVVVYGGYWVMVALVGAMVTLL